MAREKLAAYHNKRDFTATNEPKGARKQSKSGKLRFCVQKHAARAEHYDLRLEYDGVALSWAVPKGPSYNVSDKRLAMRVEDHPVDYMEFEGTIPKGEYGGGTVMLFDEGEWVPRFSPKEGLKKGSLKFFLDGKRLKGNWALVRMESSGEKGEPWLLIKERDEYAKENAGISRFRRSVRTQKTMKEIASAAKANPFSDVQVMLATPCETLPREKGWVYELKYDGHRTLCFFQDGKAVFKSRNGVCVTESFPALKREIETRFQNRAFVLDGEAVATGKDGVSNFSVLQARLKNPKRGGVSYVCFDLLSLDGEDLRPLPLLTRKSKLKTLLEKNKTEESLLSFSEHTHKLSAQQIKSLEKQNFEGVVAKRADSPYAPGRSGLWQKLKFRAADEFLVGGLIRSKHGGIASLLLGSPQNGKLVFAGKVGTGFTAAERKELLCELKPLKTNQSPFLELPKQEAARAEFIRPLLVAEIEFAERTASGLLRQASFHGIRRDKAAPEAAPSPSPAPKQTEKSPTREKTVQKSFFGVRITHPEKVLFPGDAIRKLDLATYYAAAAERMLPYLSERALSVVCCPAGIGGETFFRKHLETPIRGICSCTQQGDAEEKADFYLKSKTGILSLVQFNAIEFHIRGAKCFAKGPDLLVFDLDPDEGLPLSQTRRGARALKEILSELSLTSFLKTSGGKGYHILVPLARCADAEAVKGFAKNVALLAQKSYPALFTAEMSKAERKGKIFLDWQRNTPKATSAAPYSVRARKGAPVSMPISWDELEQVAPASITPEKAQARLNLPDPWADFFSAKKRQRLSPSS